MAVQLFHPQSKVSSRIVGLRVALALCVLLPLWLGQYSGFLWEAAPYLLDDNRLFILAAPAIFLSTKLAASLMAIFFAMGLKVRWSGTALTILFGLLEYAGFLMAPDAWNFTTHILLFVLWISWMPQDLALNWMGIYCAVLYFQAGISKLIFGGLDWTSSGCTIRGILFYHGTELSHSLVWPGLFPGLALLTVALEISILPAFLFQRFHWIILLALQAFHFSLAMLMGVSFWQLTILYFFIFDTRGAIVSRLHTRPWKESEYCPATPT